MPFNIEADLPEPHVPVAAVPAGEFAAWRTKLAARERRWLDAIGLKAEVGSVGLIPREDGSVARAVLVLPDGAAGPWDFAHLPGKLPAGSYRLETLPDGAGQADAAALGWALASYGFERYRKRERSRPDLLWPEGADRSAVARAAEATVLVRDLVNTPASDMGPAEIEAAARELGERHGATVEAMVGAALIDADYPAIHAVGRGSPREPRLIDLRWGSEDAPRVTLIGKGVAFDTGGLDLKPSGSMKLMKKDMGGAAHVLGLAHMIMDARLPVCLRVLIPAVENAVSGDAMRPLDVVHTRKGITVEIGNTDAEGRVILCDALAEADREDPALILDFATLTGAARVALGPDLPALFANDDAVAEDLLRHGDALADPMWRLPLWPAYRKLIEGKTADITNAPEGGFAGAITAALFLERFVRDTTPWAHMDVYAWVASSRPGRPEGGEAYGVRAAFALLAERFG